MADDPTALQQFLVLAKNSKGKAASMLVQQALGAPNLFHFGELLAHPNVVPLEQADKPTFDLLKIFAYGTLADYRAAAGLPALNAQQLTKLRQLTIVSLSNESKTITYAALMQQLEMGNVRELEDLVIDSIYSGLLRGKLDQKDKCLQVDFATSRDIRPGQIDAMIKTLNAWCALSDELLRALDEQMKTSANAYAAHRAHKKKYEQDVENMKKVVVAQEAEGGGHGGMGDFDDDSRGRKGTKRGGRKPGKRGGMGIMDWMN